VKKKSDVWRKVGQKEGPQNESAVSNSSFQPGLLRGGGEYSPDKIKKRPPGEGKMGISREPPKNVSWGTDTWEGKAPFRPENRPRQILRPPCSEGGEKKIGKLVDRKKKPNDKESTLKRQF